MSEYIGVLALNLQWAQHDIFKKNLSYGLVNDFYTISSFPFEKVCANCRAMKVNAYIIYDEFEAIYLCHDCNCFYNLI